VSYASKSARRASCLGDTHVDAHYAQLAGFEFVIVDDRAAEPAALRELARRSP